MLKHAFRVDLADALASAAFESYYKPQGWLLFHNTRPRRTRVTFTDNAFLAERYTHVLEVKLHSAANLGPADVGGSADPYAVLTATCGEETWSVTSSSHKKTLDPEWNEAFHMCFRNPKALTLKVSLHDNDHLRDDQMGEVELSLEGLMAAAVAEGTSGAIAQEYNLTLNVPESRGGGSPQPATVKLSCRLAPLASFTAAEEGAAATKPSEPAPQEPASPAWLRFLRTSVGRAEDLHRPDYILDETYRGILEVQLQRASGLPPFDLINGKADPFVQLSLESRDSEAWAVTSPVKDATLQPQWDETYYLRVRDTGGDSLRVRVYDKDWFRKELMGEAVLRLADLGLKGGDAAQDVEVALMGAKGTQGAGTVSLRVRLWDRHTYKPEEGVVIPSARNTSHALGRLTPVAYVDCQETDTQTQLKDVFTDLGLLPTRWNDEAHDETHTVREEDESKTAEHEQRTVGAKTTAFGSGEAPAAEHGDGGAVAAAERSGQLVHGGFHFSYDSVRDTVFGLLDEMRATRPGPWRVYVTGHSLGGALATLAAYELAERRLPADPPVVMYTYGAPRVGNKAFAEAFNALVPDAFRCTNDKDVVPRVPRLMGFCHVGTPVLLAEGKPPAVGVNREECIEGKWLYQIFGEVVRGAFQLSFVEVAGQFTKQHRHFVWSLFSGQGVMEHLGDCYVKTLRAAADLEGALVRRASVAVEAARELPHKAAVMAEAVALAATDSLKTALSNK
ncbi:hypothetical protein GPECTOR_52g71 [Gonium pectorale]|uniref:C2 domain-containing protein n=1 Tax=Gonium pectorale TaxID=33097 RepID=A0A150G758_GONPE|nr:hypothetical protein GPECTOR_52g71 [Gonium pectorale]|eukprot:KXZ45674.1 hypothetical protein GPECTOR_52g71 [Gonium pectorale]